MISVRAGSVSPRLAFELADFVHAPHSMELTSIRVYYIILVTPCKGKNLSGKGFRFNEMREVDEVPFGARKPSSESVHHLGQSK